MTQEQKSLLVAIVGKPNAGKSTLLNSMVGQKVSIVTHKVQTTRNVIRGIFTEDNTQIVFIDSPGIFEAKRRLERSMVRAAWSSVVGADLVIIIIDVHSGLDDQTKIIIQRIVSQKLDFIIVLNKIDIDSALIKKNVSLIEEVYASNEIFKISAKEFIGTELLIEYLKNKASVGQFLYPEDDITNASSKFIAAEITREKLFLNLEEEIPYRLTVDTELWKTKQDGSVEIRQVIIVTRETYKTIILGKNGSKIKTIGTQSRKEIDEVLGIKSHLFLFVKVRKDWEDNPMIYKDLGLKFVE
jgi:GTP-binding protein Era